MIAIEKLIRINHTLIFIFATRSRLKFFRQTLLENFSSNPDFIISIVIMSAIENFIRID